MKKLTLILFSTLILSACSSLPPEPKSWKDDLGRIQEEPINTDTLLLNEVMNDKNVWSK